MTAKVTTRQKVEAGLAKRHLEAGAGLRRELAHGYSGPVPGLRQLEIAAGLAVPSGDAVVAGHRPVLRVRAGRNRWNRRHDRNGDDDAKNDDQQQRGGGTADDHRHLLVFSKPIGMNANAWLSSVNVC